MSTNTTLAGLSQTAASNGPDGTTDAPSTLDDAIRYALSFIALLRDGKASVAEVTVASATTCDIGGANSPLVQITGTTTITGFGTNYTGPRFVRFAGALTLTHNASTLILPGAANITTAAGDTCIAIPLAAGWYVTEYARASGLALIPTLTSGTKQASTSGTFLDFTGIPSWAKRVTFSFSGLSTNGTSQPIVQLGTASGVEASGYLSGVSQFTSGGAITTGNFTTGLGLNGIVAATTVMHGQAVFTLLDASTNTWVGTVNGGQSNASASFQGGGSKALSGTLDRIRLTTVGGTDAFDAGSVNILYE